ncbi:MAG: radical SAM family heme chaperone HemW [Methylotetracoccus sp.]
MTPPAALSLYVHIPWCVRKCPYCDFNSHASTDALPEDDYIEALLLDLDHELLRAPERRIDTIFIGGGTPSLFGADAITRLLDGIAERARLASDVEVTLEANPGTVEASRFRGYRSAGVNRLSIGVQSFDDGMLARLGRIHDGRSAAAAVDTARSSGFDEINIDLMFGLPGQSVEGALADVETALGLGPSHLSLYQLTLEANTLFGKFPPPLPEPDILWRAQLACQSALAAAGFRQYEVSAYAQAGHECRHNLNYWRFGDYLGIGAGAHGKITDQETGALVRTAKLRRPDAYVAAVRDAPGPLPGTIVDDDDKPLEFLMNHLRLRDGFAAAAFTAGTGLPLTALEPALADCIRDGLLSDSGAVVRCTDHGWNFLEDVLGRFVR